MIPVIEFLEANKIEYVTSGANVSRNNVNINCPWCGKDDPSHHLGIALDWSAWGCWRNSKHRGRSPYTLVCKLLGISRNEARALLGVARSNLLDEDDFISKIHRLNGAIQRVDPRQNKAKVVNLEFPKSFKRLDGVNIPVRFVNFLESRGYSEKSFNWLTRAFDVRYCDYGANNNRIIFPIYKQGKLCSWIARSIYKKSKLKYLALSDDRSVTSVDDLIWPFDYVNKEGKVLIINEGLFDSLRINRYFFGQKIRACCLFGKTAGKDKIISINRLSSLYDKVVLILDPDTDILADDFGIVDQLSFVPDVCKLRGDKDPGDMTKKEIVSLVSRFL